MGKIYMAHGKKNAIKKIGLKGLLYRYLRSQRELVKHLSNICQHLIFVVLCYVLSVDFLLEYLIFHIIDIKTNNS